MTKCDVHHLSLGGAITAIPPEQRQADDDDEKDKECSDEHGPDNSNRVMKRP